MNINEAFPSQYLRAADLNGRTVPVTIASVKIETLGQGQDADRKPVLTFVGKEKRFVLNKTNSKTIEKLYGPDTDDWIGKQINLMAREVEYQGEMMLAIRVSLQAPGAAPLGTPVQSLPRSGGFGGGSRIARTAEEEANLVGQSKNEDLDEDVPF